MRRYSFLAFSVLMICWLPQVMSWGFKAHKEIAKMSVFVLPKEMIGFYKGQMDMYQDASIQPDVRRYVWPDEKPRHYIDLDRYSQEERLAMRSGWNQADTIIGTDTLMANGILPFAIMETVYQLTKAMESQDGNRIIRYSGDLAHYIGDAHVPLHTTENYNGQLSNQVGIHALWETRIPEVELAEYDFWSESATYVSNIHEIVWKTIDYSHSLVDSVLTMEWEVSSSLQEDQKYSFSASGAGSRKVYSEFYARSYSHAMNGMVERQMRSAIQMTGNLLFTCWVNAGQPTLLISKLDEKHIKKKGKDNDGLNDDETHH